MHSALVRSGLWSRQFLSRHLTWKGVSYHPKHEFACRGRLSILLVPATLKAQSACGRVVSLSCAAGSIWSFHEEHVFSCPGTNACLIKPALLRQKCPPARCSFWGENKWVRDGSNSASANTRVERLMPETIQIGAFISIDTVCSQLHPDFLPVAITIHLTFFFGFIVSCKEPRLNYLRIARNANTAAVEGEAPNL